METPSRDVLVRILESTGRPAAGRHVVLRGPDLPREGVSDEDGHVAFRQVAIQRLRAVVEVDGFSLAGIIEPGPAGETHRVTLRLPAHLGSIEGRVLDTAGRPLVGATVCVLRPGPGQPRDLVAAREGAGGSTLTDGAGRYRLEGLPVGTWWLGATAPTYGHRMQQLDAVTGCTSADFCVPRVRIVRIRGTVTDGTGTPLSGVRVEPIQRGAGHCESSDDGTYELWTYPAPGQGFDIRFQCVRYQQKTIRLSPSRLAQESEIQLDAMLSGWDSLSTIGGIVRTPDGTPLRTRVRMYSSEPHFHAQVWTGEDGRFRFDDVPRGRQYRLIALGSGSYADHYEEGLVLGPRCGPLRIELQPLETGRIRGRFVDELGQPVAHMQMHVRSDRALGRPLVAHGNASGAFELAPVPAGVLTFETAGMPQLLFSGLRLAAGEEREVDVVVDYGSETLTGRVLDASGLPRSGSIVSLCWRRERGGVVSTSVRRTRADAEGRFRFTELSPGAHRLRVHVAGQAPQEWVIPVGEVESMDCTLTHGGADGEGR